MNAEDDTAVAVVSGAKRQRLVASTAATGTTDVVVVVFTKESGEV